MSAASRSYSAFEACAYEFGPGFEAAWRVGIHELLAVETADCYGDRVGMTESSEGSSSLGTGLNPATGPFYVERARPGDVLVVSIEELRLQAMGFLAARPGAGLLGERVLSPARCDVAIDGDHASLGPDLDVPLHPMVGVVGVATDGDRVPTTTPGRHGGNLDIRELGAGSSIYLPVAQPGAGLAIGDLHAAQGDGELMVSGIEAAGVVSIRLGLVPGQAARWPWIGTPSDWMVATAAPTLEEAAALAVAEMADVLVRHTGQDLVRVGMMLSACGDLRINQVVNPLVGVRLAIPVGVAPHLWPTEP